MSRRVVNMRRAEIPEKDPAGFDPPAARNYVGFGRSIDHLPGLGFPSRKTRFSLRRRRERPKTPPCRTSGFLPLKTTAGEVTPRKPLAFIGSAGTKAWPVTKSLRTFDNAV